MDERTWWNFWNTSYRSEDKKDAISSELFSHVAGVIGEVTAPENCRMLEIACGSGTLSRLLSYSTYLGIDISPAAIEIARQKAEKPPRPAGFNLPRYEAGDFHDWPVSPQSFDLVICVDAIVCFRDQKRVLQKMAESLRPAGKLVLTTLNPFVYNRIKRTVANPIQDGPVSHWLSASELHELIRSAGFAIERSYTIMPRGSRGILRIINSAKLNRAFGSGVEAILRRLKERAGLGQYRLVVARKEGSI